MDTEPYLRIPFVPGGRDESGVDCWGLVRLVSAREYGVELPKYPGSGVSRGRIDAKALARETPEKRDRDFRRVDDPRPGDVVLLKPRQRPVHIGILVRKKPLKMLHAERAFGVAVEPVYGIAWRHRVEGFYRYRGNE